MLLKAPLPQGKLPPLMPGCQLENGSRNTLPYGGDQPQRNSASLQAQCGVQLIEFGMNTLIVAHQQPGRDQGVHILMDPFVISFQVPRQGGYGWMGSPAHGLK